MFKEQFFNEQKALMEAEYAKMKAAKIKKSERLYALSNLFDLSKHTIEQILFNKNYRNQAKKAETKTMPKSA